MPRTADTDWQADPASVRFLPLYDAYVLGAGNRDRVVARPHCDRIFVHGRGRYEGAAAQSVVLVDGVVAGMWERRAPANRVDLRMEMFADVTPRLRTAIDQQAEALGAQHELPATVVLGELGT